MKKQKGYMVLEVGYEYNDEYYSTGNYGNMYEAPKKVFSNKQAAQEELERQTIEKLKGEDLGRYNGDGLDGICEKGMQDEFCKIFKTEFDRDLDDDEYEIEIPKTATDEQVKKIMECLRLTFFELIEIEIE